MSTKFSQPGAIKLLCMLLLLICIGLTGCSSSCNLSPDPANPDKSYIHDYKGLKCLNDGDKITITFVNGDVRQGTFVELESDRVFVIFSENGAVGVPVNQIKLVKVEAREGSKLNKDQKIVIIALIVVAVVAILSIIVVTTDPIQDL